MKKVYILTLSLLMVFLFIGCNKETTNDTETSLVTTENTDVVTEEITTGFTPVEGDLHVVYPENLVIEGRTLYWDPVENAQAYAVFINGEWAANVETNSYNFTELGENKLIFQVMTKAEIGYGDSGMSVRIAYNPNRIAEIASVDAYLETVNMSGTPGFAEELVNKGMSASDVEELISGILDPLSSIDYMGISSVLDLIGSLLEYADDAEGIISAMIKCALPEMLDNEIGYYERQITSLQAIIDTGLESENEDMYLWLIDQYESYIEIDQNLLNMIEAHADRLVISLYQTLTYLDSIFNKSDTDIYTYIENMAAFNFSGTETFLVIRELGNVLEETMPDHMDLVMLYTLLGSLGELLGSDLDVDAMVSLYDDLANQTSLMIEAFIALLMNVTSSDTDDFAMLLGEEDESIKEFGLATLLIGFIDRYYSQNHDLLVQIQETCPYDDLITIMKAAFISPGVIAFANVNEDFYDMLDMYVSIYSNSEFLIDGDVMQAAGSFQLDFMGTLFDHLAEDDDFVRLFFILSSFETEFTGYDLYYSNTYLSVYYETKSQYDYSFYKYSMLLADEMVSVINEVMTGESVETQNLALQYILRTYGSLYSINMDEFTTTTMINALLGAVYNQNEVVLQTLKDFIAYLDEENVFGNLAATYDELYLTPTELDCENIKLVALFLAFDDLMDQDMMDALSGVIDSWAAQMSEHPLAFTSSDIQALADDLNQFLVDLENADVVFAGIDSSNYETVESSVADPYFNQILDDLQMLISYLIGR